MPWFHKPETQAAWEYAVERSRSLQLFFFHAYSRNPACFLGWHFQESLPELSAFSPGDACAPFYWQSQEQASWFSVAVSQAYSSHCEAEGT